MYKSLIYEISEGNPGALTFIMEASDKNFYQAQEGFVRMMRNNITGAKLYLLWNDCCNRDTDKAMDIMTSHTIEDIVQHINYENGRGIAYEEEGVENG